MSISTLFRWPNSVNHFIALRRDPEIEIARINALKVPCYFFLLEQFDEQPFKIARQIFIELWELANEERCLRQQVFWDTWQGPLMENQQSNNITLLSVLEAVHQYLAANQNDFDIPEFFITKDLPRKLSQLRDRFNRYVRLNNDHAARGRRGFERNNRSY